MNKPIKTGVPLTEELEMKDSARPSGYFWIKPAGCEWVIAYHHGGSCKGSFSSMFDEYASSELDEIDETPIARKKTASEVDL